MSKTDIKYLVMDVDGTLTDGKIYMTDAGELFKSFDVKDGYGIKNMLPELKIQPVIITGRQSRIVERRCKELDICHVYQGVRDKARALSAFLQSESGKDGQAYDFRNVAFIGDDLPDQPCILAVKESGGVTACPKDAASAVLREVDFVCRYSGGEGAVREFIEYLAEMIGG